MKNSDITSIKELLEKGSGELCSCRFQFAQEHPNHAFVGPCVHDCLAVWKALPALIAECERLREALGRLMENEVGPGPTAQGLAGHFEGCRVQWGKHCDCGIDVARAALAEVGE